jgi:replication fork clamp-binding protein CrfC
MMGTERFPETLCLISELTRLTAREDFIATCRRESFKSHITNNTIVRLGGDKNVFCCYTIIHNIMIYEFTFTK